MARSVLVDVRDFIRGFPELDLSAQQLFTGVEPDSARDPAVTLYLGAQEIGEQTHDQPEPAIEIIHLLVVCRSRKYEEAEHLANQLYKLLWRPPPWPYETVWPTGQPTMLGGPDESVRWPIGFGVRVQRQGGQYD